MREAWIQLQCPDCGEQWDDDPTDLPAPGARFTCEHCGTERPVSEFLRTARGLEILKEFYE